MYLFTRQIVLNPGHLRAGMAHALGILHYVNEKTDLDVSLFQALQGAPIGTLTFAFRTESYSASVEANDSLLQSDEYLDRVEAGAHFHVGNPQDGLSELIHTVGEVGEAPAAVSVVSATLEVSRAGSALSWSIDLANYASSLSALPMAVTTSNYGQYGRVGWISYGDSLAALEAGGKKTNTDPGFIQRLGDSEGLFVPGSATGVLARKIG